MQQVWGTGEVHTGFWWGDLRDGDHLEDSGVIGSIILKWILAIPAYETWRPSEIVIAIFIKTAIKNKFLLELGPRIYYRDDIHPYI